jgi:hypothetical protein
MILGQGGVKMILVDRYDHRTYFCGRKHAEKKYNYSYSGKYSNSHIWIWMFVKWFKKFEMWCYWVEYSKTKLLQLDSFQNQFWNSSYDQNSDLNEFECTRFVHVSTLMFLDSMMFYKIRGFQRLQICDCWMCRTKDMD